MKRSTQVISVILTTVMVFSALSGCDMERRSDESDDINRYTVIMPEPTKAEQIVDVTAAVTVNSYLTARAYLDLLLDYDIENMSESDAEEFVKLINDSEIMFENVELLSGTLTEAVDAWKYDDADQGEPELKELSASPSSFGFGQNVYAAEKSPAEQWAKDIVDAYDKAPAGKGIRTLAEQMGTDAKHAYAQLKQAQAILEGEAYTDVADKAGDIVTGLKTLKAAGTAASFVISVPAAPATVGIFEAGGIIFTGMSAVCQVGSLGSQIICGTEDNYVSAKFDDLDSRVGPLGSICSVMCLGSSFSEIGKAGKSIFSKGFSSLSEADLEKLMTNSFGVFSFTSTSLSDYINDGSILAGSFKHTKNGVEFTLMDTLSGKSGEDKERIEKMLDESGLDKSDIKKLSNDKGDGDFKDDLPKEVAEKIIEDNKPLTPDGGFEPDALIGEVTEELDIVPSDVEESNIEPDETELTEPDETEPSVEQTTTETTVETTAPKQGYWAFTGTKVITAVPHNAIEEYETVYEASEYVHTYSDLLPETDYHERQYAKFTATCSEPPQQINVGDIVTFTVTMEMDDQAGYLFTSNAFMMYISEYDPEAEGFYGPKFYATVEDAPYSCSMDTCDNVSDDHIEVYYEFSYEGLPGDQMAIVFYGCESSTAFIYTWVE